MIKQQWSKKIDDVSIRAWIILARKIDSTRSFSKDFSGGPNGWNGCKISIIDRNTVASTVAGFMISNFHPAEDASSPGEFARSLEHE